jgi:anti-sigma factor RsiW
MAMTHLEANELLQAMFDGELESDCAREVQAHVDGCPHCRNVIASWTLVRTAIRMSAGADCSPTFAAELRETMLLDQDAFGVWSAVEPLARRLVMGLAVIVLLLTVFVWTGNEEYVQTTTALSIVPADTSSSGMLLQSQELTKSDVLLATLAD